MNLTHEAIEGAGAVVHYCDDGNDDDNEAIILVMIMRMIMRMRTII